MKKIDWFIVSKNILKAVYLPVYLVGIVAITITRILLALIYFILLDPLPAKNILRNLIHPDLRGFIGSDKFDDNNEYGR